MAHGHRHTGSVASDAQPCPDPSAHEKSNKLSEQASTAALLATNPDRGTEKVDPLGPDGKLSASSAATSLKYAKAHELPSFPSLGGTTADSAGKAAMLAKDYKMKDLWQPELSAAGSKAALLAHGKGSKLDFWQPSASSDGHSAATLAMRNKGLSPQAYQGNSADDKSRALLAATMSVNKGRQRAESTPTAVHPAYPDSHNSAANALSAATASHRTSTMKLAPDGWDSEANQAARVKNLHMDPNMFTEHPPVEHLTDDASHNAALHASAVTMAKQMYEYQARNAQAQDGAGQAGAEAAAARNTASPALDVKQEALRYISLQDAAHKLAAERLAKVDKNFENARYREYYGYPGEDKSKRLSHRLSVRNALGRARASSEGNGPDDLDDSDDEYQARRIRNQMSQLNSGLSQVDAKKQQDDRARLLAAAEKRVSAQLHDMDERVFLETGKIPPSMLQEWEEKARKRATEQREEQAKHPGKTHIGGGKYMDQSEIEAIALARLRPTLDEINETAEKKRARDEEIRLDKEENERIKREEKEKDKAIKEEFKRIRNDDKAAAKREKQEEKARKEEEKRIAKEEKRKSHIEAKDAAAAGAAGVALGEVAERVKAEDEEDVDVEDAPKRRSLFGSIRARRTTKDERPKSHHTNKDAAGVAAAGATLGEVAEKVKHDQEETEEVEETKHRGLLSKLGHDKRSSKHEAKDAALAGAAGATLGEVAEKVKHSTEEPDESEETTKHRGMLGKLSDKRASKHEAKDATLAGAAGATLGEVAEKVKHDQEEPDVEATEGVSRHRSAISKLKDKFRKDKESDDPSDTADIPVEKEVETSKPQHANAATAAGVAGGAAAGALVVNAVRESEPEHSEVKSMADDESEPKPSQFGEFISVVPVEQGPVITEASKTHPEPTADEAKVDPLPVIDVSEEPAEKPVEDESSRIAFQQAGHLSRFSNDAVPQLKKPDLERHISNIPQSDDEDEDEEEEEEEPFTDKGKHSQTTLSKIGHAIADGVAPMAAGFAPVKPTHTSNVDEKDDLRAAAQADEVTHNATHKIADSFAPVTAGFAPVKPAHFTQADVETKEPLDAAVAPLDNQRVEPKTQTAAPAVVGSAGSIKKESRAGSVAIGSAGPAAEYVHRNSRDITDPARASALDAEAGESEKKGLRGFFSKLKSKQSKDKESSGKLPEFKTISRKDKDATKADQKTAAIAAAATAPAASSDADSLKPTTWADPEPLHIGTDGPIGDHTRVSGIGGQPSAIPVEDAIGPDSPSSFVRHGDEATKDLDDVSSSGVDEEDVKHGRAGRLAAKLISHKEDRNLLHKKALEDQRQHSTADAEDDEQQFEEARDHFDESAAPAPPVVEKKAVEGKGTKFTENL